MTALNIIIAINAVINHFLCVFVCSSWLSNWLRRFFKSFVALWIASESLSNFSFIFFGILSSRLFETAFAILFISPASSRALNSCSVFDSLSNFCIRILILFSVSLFKLKSVVFVFSSFVTSSSCCCICAFDSFVVLIVSMLSCIFFMIINILLMSSWFIILHLHF
mgnify:CR=1 FL=1